MRTTTTVLSAPRQARRLDVVETICHRDTAAIRKPNDHGYKKQECGRGGASVDVTTPTSEATDDEGAVEPPTVANRPIFPRRKDPVTGKWMDNKEPHGGRIPHDVFHAQHEKRENRKLQARKEKEDAYRAHIESVREERKKAWEERKKASFSQEM